MLAMDAVQKVGNGHPGTAMSLAPAAYLLFQKVMRHNPADPHWPGRDRFVLSCGHSSITLYIQLYLGGWGLELDDLKALRTWGSKTPGHPEYGHTAGVETTTGPLGQGVGNAVGMAMAARRERGLLDPDAAPGESPFDHHIYAICSDGDLQEGVSGEASSLAGTQQLGNLTLIYDDNKISIEDDTDIAFNEDVAAALRGLRLARPDRRLDQRRHGSYERGRPGALRRDPQAPSAVTDQPELHRAQHDHRLAGAQRPEHRQGPRLRPRRRRGRRHQEDPRLRPRADLRGRRRRHRAHPQAVERGKAAAGRVAERVRRVGAPSRRPTSTLFDRLQTRTLPDGLGRRPADVRRRREGHGHPQGVRRGHQRDRRPRCPSCGAARPTSPSSNNTTIEGAPSFIPEDRSTRMWTGDPSPAACCTSASASTRMGSIMNGIALHGGTRVFGGTFLDFSDYMRGAVRLAALMQLPVTYVWTHDSIGLGEDGPTHQPIEHLAALRAIPGLDVVRPADANETAAAWKAVLEHTDRPAGLALTRQNVPIFPRGEDGFADTANVAPGRLRPARRRGRRRPTSS